MPTPQYQLYLLLTLFSDYWLEGYLLSIDGQQAIKSKPIFLSSMTLCLSSSAMKILWVSLPLHTCTKRPTSPVEQGVLIFGLIYFFFFSSAHSYCLLGITQTECFRIALLFLTNQTVVLVVIWEGGTSTGKHCNQIGPQASLWGHVLPYWMLWKGLAHDGWCYSWAGGPGRYKER